MVLVAFDWPDVLESWPVFQNLRSLVAALRDQACCNVVLETWEGPKGIDDLLAAGGMPVCLAGGAVDEFFERALRDRHARAAKAATACEDTPSTVGGDSTPSMGAASGNDCPAAKVAKGWEPLQPPEGEAAVLPFPLEVFPHP